MLEGAAAGPAPLADAQVRASYAEARSPQGKRATKQRPVEGECPICIMPMDASATARDEQVGC